jgi:two-component system LytT family response regulator
MIKYAVLDDDALAIEEVENLMLNDNRFKKIGHAANLNQLEEILTKHKLQLVFADIKIGNENFLDFWNKQEQRPELILITSYPEYAINAFDHNALHFITKPIKAEGFYTAIERAYRKLTLHIASKELTFFFLQTGKNKFTRVAFDEILFVEAEGEYLKIHLVDDRELLVYKRLKSLLQELPNNRFKQTHRSYIINITQIDSIDYHETTFKGNKSVPVGKTYKSVIEEILLGNSTSIAKKG